jgi:TolB-like protein/Flp pilus assembly protein TadD
MDAPLAFGPFEFHTASGTLKRDGEPVALGTRAVALLVALAEAGGKPVAKAELMERAWPGSIVEEGNLTVQVAALRKALGAAPEGREWIVTVPRVGYRLIAGQGTETPPSVQPPSLLVLPFANLAGDAGQDYFADGVVAELITALSRFRAFAVSALSTSLAYKGRAIDARTAAHDLGVSYVLEGSVRRAGDRLRINAQLVDGATGSQLWVDRFDGTTDDVFDFQEQITEAVAMRVAPAISSAELARSRRERPGSIAAYDIYLRSLAHILNESAEENATALALLEQALVLEPDNPAILAHTAWALEHRYTMGWPPYGQDDVARCVEVAHKGLEKAAGDGRVMAHCGMALLQTGKEYDLALAVIREAAATNPNDVLIVAAAGIAELHCGDIDGAVAQLERASRLAPRGSEAHLALTGLAMAAIIRGDPEAALALATRSLALNARFDATYWMLAASSAHLERTDEARRWLGELDRVSPGATLARIRQGQPAKFPERIGAVLDGLRKAGMTEA